MKVKTLILGAGAAGLMCGAYAGKAGSTLILDHAKRAGDKIRISGGGRCNFTNIHTKPANFISQNRHFAKSALARYTPQDFIALTQAHGLTYTEKSLGQLFCDQKSGAIIQMLLDELGEAELHVEISIGEVRETASGFAVETSAGMVECENLVIATGGKSIPKMGATGLGYDIAGQFGLPLIDTFAGLVPFTFTGQGLAAMAERSGVSLDANVKAGKTAFREGMLFTHRGLSGPSMLQASSYWTPGQPLFVDFCPGEDMTAALTALRAAKPQLRLSKALSAHVPEQAATFLLGLANQDDVPLQELSKSALEGLGQTLNNASLNPAGTEGYRTAEVTVGGVDTSALSSQTMASKAHPNLFFIGEVVDVTGWLGGYNFQWAWASAVAAGKAIAAS